MLGWTKQNRAVVWLCAVMSLTGCSVQQMASRQLANGLSASDAAYEDDPLLVRDASPFYLKLSESVLRQQPDHVPLAVRVSGGFTQYAYAFVAQEAEFIEQRDPAQADVLRARAKKLYRRALGHAQRALDSVAPTWRSALRIPGATNPIKNEHVELAYWTAAAWGALISLSKDEPETLADLPEVVRLAHWAWQVHPTWGDGALTGLLATLEASRPGGSRTQASALFDLAIEQSAGLSVGAFVNKAELGALPAGDSAEFQHLLQQALAVQTPPGHALTLSNAVMRRRATWLQARTSELF